MRVLVSGAVLVLLLSTAAHTLSAQEAVMLEPGDFAPSPYTTDGVIGGVNLTCFRICQAGTMPASAKPAAPQAAGTAGDVQQSSSTSNAKPSIRQDAGSNLGTTSAGPDPTSTARKLLVSNSTTANGTSTSNSTAAGALNSTSGSSTSTSRPSTGLAPVVNCAGMDPQAASVLAARYRGFQVHLALSDFFEIIYASGNLWYAVVDLLKQGLAGLATGHIQVDAASILLFNQNVASITAWWVSGVHAPVQTVCMQAYLIAIWHLAISQ
jgi:hypothetical protein